MPIALSPCLIGVTALVFLIWLGLSVGLLCRPPEPERARILGVWIGISVVLAVLVSLLLLLYVGASLIPEV